MTSDSKPTFTFYIHSSSYNDSISKVKFKLKKTQEEEEDETKKTPSAKCVQPQAIHVTINTTFH